MSAELTIIGGEVGGKRVITVDETQFQVGSNGELQLVNPPSPLAAGIIEAFGGAAAPSGWLECDGSVVAQATFPDLFTAIGTTWDTGGEGAGNFRLPDLRGVFIRGTGTHGTLDMADGNAFAGPALGASENDKAQGHWHRLLGVSVNNAPTGSSRITISGSTILSNKVTTPITDGVNGTPRSGDETNPVNFGILYIIKT